MPYEYLERSKKTREQIKKELEGIPRGDLDQNMVRQAYWGIRSHNLGKNVSEPLSKEETLAEAIKIMQKDDPCYWPRYNDKIFDNDKLTKAAEERELNKNCKNKNLKGILKDAEGCEKNIA